MPTKITWRTTVIETYTITLDDGVADPTQTLPPDELDMWLADNEYAAADEVEVTERDLVSNQEDGTLVLPDTTPTN